MVLFCVPIPLRFKRGHLDFKDEVFGESSAYTTYSCTDIVKAVLVVLVCVLIGDVCLTLNRSRSLTQQQPLSEINFNKGVDTVAHDEVCSVSCNAVHRLIVSHAINVFFFFFWPYTAL
jgi:hypothetical protein